MIDLNKINPRKLFLIDSLGGLLSAFMLGIILVEFRNLVGMSPKILYLLSVFAIGFFIYSFTCFVMNLEKWRFFLKIIAVVNLLYCCMTLFLIIYFHEGITNLGFVYFILEIIIIIVLSLLELKVSIRQ
ncbi:MAG: hypothetical protein ACPG5P_07145 [Saprospiraceae bacterium]